MVKGVRSRRRPRARWRDGIIEDIQEQGLWSSRGNLSPKIEMAGGSLLGPIVAMARTDGTEEEKDLDTIEYLNGILFFVDLNCNLYDIISLYHS